MDECSYCGSITNDCEELINPEIDSRHFVKVCKKCILKSKELQHCVIKYL
jgi:hypothetical protein